MKTVRRSIWIAADLLGDAAASGPFWILGGFFAVWLPFQAGLIDGLTWRGAPPFALRRLLTMNAAWPAMVIPALHAHVLLPRRIRRELEPLLAAPAGDLDLVLGFSLPVLGVIVAAPPLTLLLNVAGYRLGAGRVPAGLAAELGWLCAATAAAGLWLTAFSLDAALRANGPGGYTIRVVGVYALLGAVDALQILLRLAGCGALAAPAIGVAIPAGAGALWLVARRLDREILIRRI